MAGGGSEPGERRGGRQKGTPNKATAEIRALAMGYGPQAFQELAKLGGLARDDQGAPLAGAQSETARLSAIGMLIDRAYGRALPGRMITLDLPDTCTVEGVTKAVAVVIRAAATGQITPGEAGDLCGVLEAQRRTIELSEIEARLAKLEVAQRVPV